MIRRVFITALVAGSLATSVLAGVREVDQDELRGMVQAGKGLSLGTVLSTVAQTTGGETVGARAFDADGLIYTILVMLNNGKMAYVFIDGVTGQVVNPSSTRAKDVLALAQSSFGNGNGKGKAKGIGMGAQKSQGKNQSGSRKK